MLIGGVVVFLLSMGLRSALARIFGTLPQILDEGLIILAWLALWRPAEMLLYGWIPLRRKRRLYERFAGIRVFVRPDTLAPTVTSRVPITAAPRGASYKLTARTSNTGSGLSLTMYSASLLLRMGRMPLISPPRDIAEAIVFRIRSDFIIGHVIDVDGGRHL